MKKTQKHIQVFTYSFVRIARNYFCNTKFMTKLAISYFGDWKSKIFGIVLSCQAQAEWRTTLKSLARPTYTHTHTHQCQHWLPFRLACFAYDTAHLGCTRVKSKISILLLYLRILYTTNIPDLANENKVRFFVIWDGRVNWWSIILTYCSMCKSIFALDTEQDVIPPTVKKEAKTSYKRVVTISRDGAKSVPQANKTVYEQYVRQLHLWTFCSIPTFILNVLLFL